MVTTRDAAGRTRRVDLDLSALPAGSYPAEAPRFESFDYDGLGRMRRHQNDVCDVRLDIDSLGRQVAERTTYPAGAGSPGTLAIGRVYDLAGKPHAARLSWRARDRVRLRRAEPPVRGAERESGRRLPGHRRSSCGA
jgi:hypothetical protein